MSHKSIGSVEEEVGQIYTLFYNCKKYFKILAYIKSLTTFASRFGTTPHRSSAQKPRQDLTPITMTTATKPPLKRQRGRPKKDTKVVYRRVPTYMYDLIIHTIEELISKFTKAN